MDYYPASKQCREIYDIIIEIRQLLDYKILPQSLPHSIYTMETVLIYQLVDVLERYISLEQEFPDHEKQKLTDQFAEIYLGFKALLEGVVSGEHLELDVDLKVLDTLLLSNGLKSDI